MTLNPHLTDEGRENWFAQGARGSLDLNSALSTTEYTFKPVPPSLASLLNLAMNANSHTLGLPWVGGDAAGKKMASPRIDISRDTDIREGLPNGR